MTNAELNLSLAKLVYKGFEPYQDPFGDDVHLWRELPSGQELNLVRNYLNNWNDLMPLVVEHEIELRTAGMFAGTGLGWSAFHNPANQGKTLSTLNDNPQIALVECLIKVLEAKQ